jgi:hypothetical protein
LDPKFQIKLICGVFAVKGPKSHFWIYLAHNRKLSNLFDTIGIGVDINNEYLEILWEFILRNKISSNIFGI